MPPAKQGLYDPAHEHDACGVGFLVDIAGRKSNRLVRDALTVLKNLGHRGACGCEDNTGDGAGALLQMPHEFLRQVASEQGIKLPGPGKYGVAMLFLPDDDAERALCEQLFEESIRSEGQTVLGWRTVPTDNSALGKTARECQPVIKQVFIGRGANITDEAAFERCLYVIRRVAKKRGREHGLQQQDLFYCCSCSTKTIVYKGMLTSDQLDGFFPDLRDPRVESALCMVHSRFSTNTFPSWARAHPYRTIAHNGEINTLRGNVNWMNARQSVLESPLFGTDIAKVKPVIDQTGSDSAMLDNVLEMLTLGGRELPHAVMMMVPEPWAHHESMSAERRAFYEYHSCLMEPWDGPAAIAFSDGVQIGAVLDRNGLRPLRYYVTRDGLVALASEVGVLPDLPPAEIATKGRIQPGCMFLVDTAQQRIISDDEIKDRYARAQPYADWVKQYLVSMGDLPAGKPAIEPDQKTLTVRQEAFGYTTEDVDKLILPMAQSAGEATGSMGTDTPLAVLSVRPQTLYNYFQQLFAQVTNPPVDAIREEIIMAVETAIGPERNLFDPRPESAHQIELPTAVLFNDELEKLRSLDGSKACHGFRSSTLSTLFPVQGGGKALEEALLDLCEAAARAVADGCEILILSDRDHGPKLAPIPALLACAAVHHHLLREGSRTRVGLVLETGEPREVHHFCLLIGYGASAVNPYLAFETIAEMVKSGRCQVDAAVAKKNYIKAVGKGIVKVISKMGISTVQSYHGAQVFEAIGLGKELIDDYFTGTASRIGGIGLPVIAEEVRLRHERAYPSRPTTHLGLDNGGQYQWRSDGEYHLFNPETIHKLQAACRTGSYDTYKQYARLVNDQSKTLCTLRGLMEFAPQRSPVSIDEVEPVDAIVKRFKTGAMSYGSISKEAHETLAIAMNRIGGKSNTGEGGEDPARYVREPNGDSKNSAIKQVASGRFGVTSNYLVQAQELQIKMAQGAKPGEGGQLPGSKVYPEIAKVRNATPGVGLISPPPHHDIYSIEDLAQLIHDLKCANDRARISVKLVAEVGVGTVAAGVAKAKADVVLISGHDGGTGASPLTSIKHAGIPWEMGLAETQQVLLLNNLRSRITVETDGQLKTGRDVVVGALLGAEEFGFSTAPLVALGCILMRVCHLNTCPVGVATQDPKLRAKFAGAADHVVNFMRFVAQDVRELMASLGFRRFDEMVGKSECLETRSAVDHWKANGVDLSAIFHKPAVSGDVGVYCQTGQNHGLQSEYDDTTIIPLVRDAIDGGAPVQATLPIRNVHRTVGARLGSEVTRRHGPTGLPDDTIRLHFQGSAGQSFGAFLPAGVTLTLEGDANDYVGKGLSGGRIVLYPSAAATFVPSENIIVGNVVLYGATSGEAFIRGIAGERFCVRNSGADAVVEAVGDHGCEYMTGGRVVILGPTGRNFAAGMSGGIAYVYDEARGLQTRCNKELVSLSPLGDQDAAEVENVLRLLRKHAQLTGSTRATFILENWAQCKPLFVAVVPNDYRRVMDTQRQFLLRGLSPDEAAMAAFEVNIKDVARAHGK